VVSGTQLDQELKVPVTLPIVARDRKVALGSCVAKSGQLHPSGEFAPAAHATGLVVNFPAA
jgi:hypothetical protein